MQGHRIGVVAQNGFALWEGKSGRTLQRSPTALPGIWRAVFGEKSDRWRSVSLTLWPRVPATKQSVEALRFSEAGQGRIEPLIGKVLVTIFGDPESILLIGYMQQNTLDAHQYFAKLLCQFHDSIKEKTSREVQQWSPAFGRQRSSPQVRNFTRWHARMPIQPDEPPRL